jgi:hypothetical protein
MKVALLASCCAIFAIFFAQNCIAQEYPALDEQKLAVLVAESDLVLGNCFKVVKFDPIKYLELQRKWRDHLLEPNGTMEISSYELWTELHAYDHTAKADQIIYCKKRLVNLSSELGIYSPFELLKGSAKP